MTTTPKTHPTLREVLDELRLLPSALEGLVEKDLDAEVDHWSWATTSATGQVAHFVGSDEALIGIWWKAHRRPAFIVRSSRARDEWRREAARARQASPAATVLKLGPCPSVRLRFAYSA